MELLEEGKAEMDCEKLLGHGLSEFLLLLVIGKKQSVSVENG